LYVFFILINI